MDDLSGFTWFLFPLPPWDVTVLIADIPVLLGLGIGIVKNMNSAERRHEAGDMSGEVLYRQMAWSYTKYLLWTIGLVAVPIILFLAYIAFLGRYAASPLGAFAFWITWLPFLSWIAPVAAVLSVQRLRRLRN